MRNEAGRISDLGPMRRGNYEECKTDGDRYRAAMPDARQADAATRPTATIDSDMTFPRPVHSMMTPG